MIILLIKKISLTADFVFLLSMNKQYILLLFVWVNNMYKGNQTHSKLEIVIYIMTLLLIDRRLDPNYIMQKFNLTPLTLVRYISTIKNSLIDFGIYYIEIFYDRKYNVYRCIINE